MRQDLVTVLNADVRALQQWIERGKLEVESWAENDRVRELARELVEISEQSAGHTAREQVANGQEPTGDRAAIRKRLLAADERRQITDLLEPLHGRTDVLGVVIFRHDGLCLAHTRESAVGESVGPRGATYLGRLVLGETFLVKPYRKYILGQADAMEEQPGPLMGIVAPIRSVTGTVIGGLLCLVAADEEYSEILQTARLGQTGETYAFDADLLLLSNPRYPELLVAAGLLDEDERTALNIAIRVPGDPSRSSLAEAGAPTWIASKALADGEALNLDGYLNYRGVPVVGAARWLPEFDFGICTEVEQDEAFAPLRYVEWFATILLGLIFLLAAMTAAYSYRSFYLEQEVERTRRMRRLLARATHRRRRNGKGLSRPPRTLEKIDGGQSARRIKGGATDRRPLRT